MAQPTFSCASCGKTHSWKPELAGRKARCKCGSVVTVPAAAPGGEPELDALYDLIPSEQDLKQDVPAVAVAANGGACPSCSAAIVPGAVLCVSCGYNFKTGAQMQTTAAAPAKKKAAKGRPAPGSRGRGGAEAVGLAPASEMAVPSALAVAGIGLGVWAIMQGTSASLGLVLIAFLVATVIQAIMIFAGCLLSVKLADISLGQPVPAIVKVLALAVAPAAVQMLVTKFTGFWYYGWACALVMYYFMLHLFFELDGGETLFVAAIIYVVGMGAQLLIGLLLLQMGIAPIATMGGFDSNTQDLSPQQKKMMAKAADLDTGHLPTPWIDSAEYLKNEKNQFRGLKREEFVQIIDNFNARGAVKLIIPGPKVKDDVGEAIWLIIELPAGAPEVRKKIFQYHREILKKYNGSPEMDEIGQRFLRFWIPSSKLDDDEPKLGE